MRMMNENCEIKKMLTFLNFYFLATDFPSTIQNNCVKFYRNRSQHSLEGKDVSEFKFGPYFFFILGHNM